MGAVWPLPFPGAGRFEREVRPGALPSAAVPPPSPKRPSPLGEDERSRLRAQLAAEQRRLQGQLAGLERTFEDLVAGADVEPADDEHDPDGTTAYERAQISSLARVTRSRLAEVDAALDAAVHDPAFGECRSCGTPIGLERLAAMPGTVRCVRCAAG